MKIISIFYLILLSVLFLVPQNFFVLTQIITIENIPDNNSSFAIHFVLFFILFLLFSLSFSNSYNILLFCIIYSVIIENLQLFTSRGFQISDIIFNLLGLFSSYLFLVFFRKIIKKYK